MRCLALGLLLAAAACSGDRAGITSVSIGESRYHVPDAHIVSAALQPHQFLRIKPPERDFELVYDSRTAARSDQFAWPLIFSLNDERAPDIQRRVAGDLVIVCRPAAQPKGGCGIKVQHDGVEWAILFPYARQDEAAIIRQRALAALSAYRA